MMINIQMCCLIFSSKKNITRVIGQAKTFSSLSKVPARSARKDLIIYTMSAALPYDASVIFFSIRRYILKTIPNMRTYLYNFYYALMILKFIICWKKFSYKMYATSIHSAMHCCIDTIYTDCITVLWTQGEEKCIFENLYYIYYTFIEKHRILLCIF